MFLVILFGFISVYYGIAGIPTMFDKGMGYFIYALVIEAVMISLFVFFLRRYIVSGKWEQHKAKKARKREESQREREEWIAGAPERERKHKEVLDKKRELKRLRTTIVSTRLIGEGSAEYKKSVGNVLVRGAVGGILGGAAGAALGAATAKNKNTNKNVRRFLVKYLDGHIEEKEATIGSSKYKEYMEHLEWNE